MSFIDVGNDTLVNLDNIKTIQKNDDFSAVIHFVGEDEYAGLLTSLPYEYLVGLIKMRSNRESDAANKTNETLRRILSGQTTPVP